MKRIIAACLFLILTVGMITASASPAGSVGDPLITQRYLEGAFADSLKSGVTAALDGATGEAMARLNEMYMEAAGYSFAPRFTQLSIPSGGTVALGPGASFVLLSGSATITVSAGTAINISTGNIVASGTAILGNHRIFCTENTSAIVTVSSAATGQVDGFYYVDAAIRPPQPPVTPPPPGGSSGLLPFTDVSSGAWFYNAVSFVFNNEIFAGTSATTFSPNTAMTRGMFVTVLHRLDGLPEVGAGGTFTDVRNPDAFYYDAVTWASDNGIVTGFPDGTFRPGQAITREQMATVMHLYALYSGRNMALNEDALNGFSDSGNVSAYALDPMRWAVSRAVIRGTSGGRLLPQNTASRAEVAQIILNYTENVVQ